MKTNSKDIPRGFRNNNPTNIRHSPAYHWQGEVASDDRGFCVFIDNTWGYRATFKLLKNYNQTHLLYTVPSIIRRWAPPSDGNNTNAYILRVCQIAGLTDKDIIVVDSMDEADNEKVKNLVKAMAMVENGCSANAISMDEINKGFDMAFRRY